MNCKCRTCGKIINVFEGNGGYCKGCYSGVYEIDVENESSIHNLGRTRRPTARSYETL